MTKEGNAVTGVTVTGVTVTGVTGLPEIAAGDDLGALIADATPGLSDGDIVVITSKVVSKAEGRVVRADREHAISAETVRVVARRGPTTIAETRHGLVLAAAGVDASNTPAGTVVLLPDDPDGSARQLRKALRARRGASVGVIITDTMGRPWRIGQTDTAIGVAGLAPLRDHRGQADTFGNPLEVTVAAVADEIAAAADLVKGKTRQVPVAVVRGLADLVTDADGTCSGWAPPTCCPPAGPYGNSPPSPSARSRSGGPLRPRSPRPRRTTACHGASRSSSRPRRRQHCLTTCLPRGPRTCAATGSPQSRSRGGCAAASRCGGRR